MAESLHKFIVAFLFILIGQTATAGGDFMVTGAREAGMGRSSVALTGFWNIQNNQAGIALMDHFGAGIYYEAQFGLTELSSKSAAFMAPTKFGVLGVTFNHFGYSAYNDMKVGLVYARSFGPYFRFGVQLDYLQTTIGDNYGSKKNVTFEIGIQSDITEKLTLGAYVYNPIMIKMADYDDERVPAIFRLGIAWKIAKGFVATLEGEKNTNFQPITIRGGLEYGLKDKFFFRGGFGTQKEIFSMGFGFKLKMVRFDISAVMHESLGFSPQGSLVFQF